ncbi:MAG: UvrB/UvrC motif-containing protein [Clostridia bacterium]|nr:UvrB/UvrC motif-containing protein [Clostridia bacterium]
MLCDKCKKRQASVHIKTLINGVYVEKHLCSECARDYDSELDILSPSGIVSSMFSTIEGPTAKRCKNCGTTATEFKRSGKAGCSECYKAFEDTILPIVKRVQGTLNHVGRAPSPVVKERSEIDQLRYEMEEAVRKEDYRLAAEIRDKIKALEGGRQDG